MSIGGPMPEPAFNKVVLSKLFVCHKSSEQMNKFEVHGRSKNPARAPGGPAVWRS